MEAYERAVHLWSSGHFDWMEAESAGEETRAIFAQLIGAQREEIAIVPTVSAAAGIVAANLPPAGRGESIVLAGSEFSSNCYPWLLLRHRGYDVRMISSTDDAISPEAYGTAADDGTRLIAVSAVHSATGYRTDLAKVSQVAARCGAWLFVDAAQAVGAVPLDVVCDRVDFLAAASHKFLLGSRGMGYLFVRRRLLDRMRPVLPGWKAARRPQESFHGPAMELSTTASKLDISLTWFAALAERAALGAFQQFGIEAILARNAQLSRHLHDSLIVRGCRIPRQSERNRSTIVSVPVRDTAAAMARLRGAGVVASARAGRVRLSVHFYNSEDEINRAADVLSNE
jgi:selenocysteine lyase/cysteine desulfurase